MKNKITLLIFILALSAFSIHAQTTCNQTPEQIAKSFSAAFKSKKLNRLDVKSVGKITLTMENSLVDDGAKNQFAVKKFANLKALENWLTKRETDQLPGRTANALISCKKGVCSFKINGLLHNTLFLKKVTLGFTKDKCPYIKSIYIVDGN